MPLTPDGSIVPNENPQPDSPPKTRLDVMKERVEDWNHHFADLCSGKREVDPSFDQKTIILNSIDFPDALERLTTAEQVIRVADRLHAEFHGAQCTNPLKCVYVLIKSEHLKSGRRFLDEAIRQGRQENDQETPIHEL